jgi:hypothetical protein
VISFFGQRTIHRYGGDVLLYVTNLTNSQMKINYKTC